MEISLKNPVPLLSVNFLGLGFAISYVTQQNETFDRFIMFELNLIFWTPTKMWKV